MAMNGTPKAGGSGFKMSPGSKQVDSPSTFRKDSPLAALGMNPAQAGMAGAPGASPMMQTKDKKKTTSKKDDTKGPRRGTTTKKVGKYIKYKDSYGGSTKNTDLLKVGKKYYNKAKKYIKSKMK